MADDRVPPTSTSIVDELQLVEAAPTSRGFFSVIVTSSVALAIIVAIAGFAQRTEAAGRRLDRPVRAVMGRPRKSASSGTAAA